jgi:endoglucanase
MAKRYANQPFVVGADLRNELRCVPGGSCATWGGSASTDWHAAAERGGDAILGSNPNLLIFVEGPKYDTDLSSVAALPVTLSLPGHLVYEAHDYGFSSSSKPLSGFADWVARITPRWGYLVTGANPQPLWLGKFGTCNTADTCVASSKNTDLGFWFQIIVQYIETSMMRERATFCHRTLGNTGRNRRSYLQIQRVFRSRSLSIFLSAASNCTR